MRATANEFAQSVWRTVRGRRCRQQANIIRQLRDTSFRFSAYNVFSIRDPKSRMIHAPSFADRVVHHAIIAVTGPGFERGAMAHSYACRGGFGQHRALRQAMRWVRKHACFLKMDIAKYYDTVDHDELRIQLARRFRERRLLSLFDRLIDSYSPRPGKGLPIGALTSQYLGNFYLDPFDRWVKQRQHVKHYLRYMDDMLLWGGHQSLRQTRIEAQTVLGEMGLKMKHGGELNRCQLGVPFLGFVLYPNRIRQNHQGRKRFRRKFQALERDFERQRITESELQTRSEALFAHICFADDAAWRREVLRFSMSQSY